MKSMITGVAIATSLIGSAAFAACEMPSLVAAIPDGATASEQQLLAVQAEVRAYVEAMDRYIACQNGELAAQGDNATADYRYQMSMRIESARREVDAVAGRFNAELNAFLATRPAAAFPPR
jgi:hypothetical protein